MREVLAKIRTDEQHSGVCERQRGACINVEKQHSAEQQHGLEEASGGNDKTE